MRIFVGHLDTGNFEFTTYAHTATEAQTLMKSAWKVHQKNTSAWLTWKELKTSVHIEAVKIGSYQIH